MVRVPALAASRRQRALPVKLPRRKVPVTSRMSGLPCGQTLGAWSSARPERSSRLTVTDKDWPRRRAVRQATEGRRRSSQWRDRSWRQDDAGLPHHQIEPLSGAPDTTIPHSWRCSAEVPFSDGNSYAPTHPLPPAGPPVTVVPGARGPAAPWTRVRAATLATIRCGRPWPPAIVGRAAQRFGHYPRGTTTISRCAANSATRVAAAMSVRMWPSSTGRPFPPNQRTVPQGCHRAATGRSP